MFGGGCSIDPPRLIAEQVEWKLKFASNQSKPYLCFKDVGDTLLSQLQPVNPNAPQMPMDFVPPPDNIDFGIAGPPGVDMIIQNNNKAVLSSCVALGTGKSGSGVRMTQEFMRKYKPLVMIVEIAMGANVTYSRCMEMNLDALEALFKEAGYEVQTLSTYADRWLSQRRARFYMACVHNEKFEAVHCGSIALLGAMQDLRSLW